MLKFNSKENLLLNLQSNNAVATMLYENPQLRRELMTFLKNFREETGRMPREKYGSILDVLFDMRSQGEILQLLPGSYNIEKLSKG